MKEQLNIFGVGVAPWVNSGYGKQLGFVLPWFASQGHRVRMYAYRGLIGAGLTWPRERTEMAAPIEVLPQGRMSHFGWEILPYYINDFKPDLIFSLHNLFAYDEIKSLIAQEGWNWHHWTPVDSSPLGAPDYHVLNITGIKPIAMTKFGQTQLADADLPAPYIPHSIDTAHWIPPAEQERLAAREHLGIPEDTFVIGMNATNEASADRKGFWETLCAFQGFHSRHPNSLLFLHTVAYRHPIGLDIPSMLTRLELNDAVIFPGVDEYNAGAITDTDLRDRFYWVCDLGSACSRAEGFCLPAAEFQSCGVPIVVSNCSSLTEVSAPGQFGAFRVPVQPAWSTLDSSGWATPLISHIEDAYEMFYREWRSGEIEPYRVAARSHVLQYDHRRVTAEHWAPFLAAQQKEAS